jgi:hypothetical protein
MAPAGVRVVRSLRALVAWDGGVDAGEDDGRPS